MSGEQVFVEARLTDGFPYDGHERYGAELRCGRVNCGAIVGRYWLDRAKGAYVELREGFGEITVQGVTMACLTPRVMKQWEQAKQKRIAWHKFIPKGRRGRRGPEDFTRQARRDGGVDMAAPRYSFPFARQVRAKTPLAFMCPVCRTVSCLFPWTRMPS